MGVYLTVALTVLTHTSFKGSKVVIALYAYELGANPLTIGLLFSMYSLFPIFLSVYAGKLSDRYGSRIPMLFGATGLVVGLLLPFAFPRLATLFVSATLIGVCYLFYIVSVQHLIGSIGEAANRTRNYSIFGLGIAFTALIGPTTAGFAIDAFGYQNAYLLLAVIPGIPILAMLVFPRLLPSIQIKAKPPGKQRTRDLLRNRPLRRALITAGVIETGVELFNFFLPIYGRSIDFSASQIGIIIGTFGAAQLVVRTILPALVRRSSEERVLSTSLYLAAATYLVFPFVSSFAGLLVMAFVLGLGLGTGSPISLVLAYNRSPAGRSGEALGIRQTVNKVTETTMPIVFGSLGVLATVAAFWADAAMLAVGAWLIGKDAIPRRSKPPPEVASHDAESK